MLIAPQPFGRWSTHKPRFPDPEERSHVIRFVGRKSCRKIPCFSEKIHVFPYCSSKWNSGTSSPSRKVPRLASRSSRHPASWNQRSHGSWVRWASQVLQSTAARTGSPGDDNHSENHHGFEAKMDEMWTKKLGDAGILLRKFKPLQVLGFVRPKNRGYTSIAFSSTCSGVKSTRFQLKVSLKMSKTQLQIRSAKATSQNLSRLEIFWCQVHHLSLAQKLGYHLVI